MTSLPEKPPATANRHEAAEEFIPLEVDLQQDSSRAKGDKVTTLDMSGSNSPANPPLPMEEPPPLPNEPTPDKPEDDGWEPLWDDSAQAYYFYNRFTKVTQWDNPRVREEPPSKGLVDSGPPGADVTTLPKKPTVGGYDPAIHGDYDPNADYAKAYRLESEDTAVGQSGTDPTDAYAATGAFNRFTGKWQKADINPENFNDENKSKRQMNAYFDVDAAANTHDGRSLKAERSGKKLSKKELKAFKEKRREKKEEKRRAWLRD